MRLWAGMGLLCAVLAGCRHLPEGVTVDVRNRTVEVGPCRCRLPDPEGNKAKEEPRAEPPADNGPR